MESKTTEKVACDSMQSEITDRDKMVNNSANENEMKMETSKHVSTLKRTHEVDDEESIVPVKKIALLKPNIPKNPLCLLNELYRGVEFKIIDQVGPANAPIFTASVEINGVTFEGKGRNKKSAKQTAAESALRARYNLQISCRKLGFSPLEGGTIRTMVEFKNPESDGPNICISNSLKDFTNNVQDKGMEDFNKSKATESDRLISDDGGEKNGLPTKRNPSKFSMADKNPVMLLNELHPTAKYVIVAHEGAKQKSYITSVSVNSQKFEGTGISKKSSKAAAARSALLICYNISIPAGPIFKTEKLIASSNGADLPQIFSDHISRLINEKYESLMKDDSAHVRRKVLSGFVMSKGYNMNTCKVICVSTGTKCINGERLSSKGSVLNDCHAEIISRRCLCNFFYSELEKHLSGDAAKDSIFLRDENGFRLDPQYRFHLYINSAPCGDSRMFSPHEACLVDKHPNRKARGQLRTKIECGEGTIPVKSTNVVQTWDGVLQGERLLTMSCSDKIAKWNVVGLQGALLSNFLEPVYLDSIVLGSLFHPGHLHRAVCGRIENQIVGLPPPYRMNKPKLSTILNPEMRQIGKSPGYSVNWTLGDSEVEVVNASSGKTETNRVSRLSKCRLFGKYLNLLEKMKIKNGSDDGNGGVFYYSQCKEQAESYQVAKMKVFKAFSESRLGEWVKKPIEVDRFEWDAESLENFLTSHLSEETIS